MDLSMYDETYENTEVEERVYGDVPDGKYQVLVDRIKMTETKDVGRPMLAWGFKIIAGPHKGRFLFKNSVITTEENIKFIKQDLVTCGLKLEKFSDLEQPEKVMELIGIALEITQQTKGEYANIFINKCIDIGEEVEYSDDIAF